MEYCGLVGDREGWGGVACSWALPVLTGTCWVRFCTFVLQHYWLSSWSSPSQPSLPSTMGFPLHSLFETCEFIGWSTDAEVLSLSLPTALDFGKLMTCLIVFLTLHLLQPSPPYFPQDKDTRGESPQGTASSIPIFSKTFVGTLPTFFCFYGINQREGKVCTGFISFPLTFFLFPIFRQWSLLSEFILKPLRHQLWLLIHKVTFLRLKNLFITYCLPWNKRTQNWPISPARVCLSKDPVSPGFCLKSQAMSCVNRDLADMKHIY